MKPQKTFNSLLAALVGMFLIAIGVFFSTLTGLIVCSSLPSPPGHGLIYHFFLTEESSIPVTVGLVRDSEVVIYVQDWNLHAPFLIALFGTVGIALIALAIGIRLVLSAWRRIGHNFKHQLLEQGEEN